MRILMFGRGTISVLYGQALQDAGHEVEYYVRPGRSAHYGDSVEVDITDARRGRADRTVRGKFPTRLRESFAPGDRFDLVVVSVGHHHLSEAAALLAPHVGAATVFVFGNIWEEPATAVSPLPMSQVVFGFPQGGGGFDADGVLRGALLRSVIIGRSDEVRSDRERAVSDVFRQAGFGIREEPDMRGWLLLHFIFDAGMFTEGVKGAGLAGMIGDRRAFRRAFRTTRELLPIVAARGVDLRRHRQARLLLSLAAVVSVAIAVVTARVPIARVSLAAHADPHTPEAHAILRDVLHSGQQLDMATPRLAEAVRSFE